MGNESTNTSCVDHNFKRVEEQKGPKGEWVLCCSKCGKLTYSAPPKPLDESKRDKPLLME